MIRMGTRIDFILKTSCYVLQHHANGRAQLVELQATCTSISAFQALPEGGYIFTPIALGVFLHCPVLPLEARVACVHSIIRGNEIKHVYVDGKAVV